VWQNLEYTEEISQGVHVAELLLETHNRIFVRCDACSHRPEVSAQYCVHGWQGLKKGHWSQLRFHGDDMLRPAASNEIAWLAVVLVRLSMWINRALGLDRPPDEDAHPDNIFQVRRCTLSHAVPVSCFHASLLDWDDVMS